MEESQDLLMLTLEKSGVSIPENVKSIRDLSPESLVSICAQSLNLMDGTTSFAEELPDSVAERFRICTDIALAVKNLGYIGDITYYKFLYPSEEDTYKLVRFLVELLSESSEGIKASGINGTNDRLKIEEDNFENTSGDGTQKKENEAVDVDLQKVEAVLKDLIHTSETPESSNSEVLDAIIGRSFNVDLFSEKMDELDVNDASSSRSKALYEDRPDALLNRQDLLEQPQLSETGESGDEVSSFQTYNKHVSEPGDTSMSEDPTSKIRYDINKLRIQEKILLREVTARGSELCCLEDELELLETAAERIFDNNHPIEFHLEHLNEQVAARRCNLMDLERQWNDVRQHLEMKKRSLEESLYADKPEAQEKLQKLREIELEKQSVLSELRKREEEKFKLQADLERQPKMASRRSYIERIKEITKNSRKLDADIQRILKETKELQLESNAIQERLHRSYAVVDEMVFREAKEDPAGRQIYKLLTNIHGIFGHISEKILVTDRLRREVAEHEKKLAGIASRGLTVEKIQADLDAIRRENEYLEKHLPEN